MTDQIAQTSAIQQAAEDNDDIVIDLRDLTRYFFRHRWLLICSALIGGVLMATVALSMRNVFESQALLAPAQNNSNGLSSISGQLGGLASIAGIQLGTNDQLTTEAIALFTSRSFLLGFIQDLGIKPALFPDSWDADQKKWAAPGGVTRIIAALQPSSDTNDRSKYASPNEPTDSDTYTLFRKNFIAISQDKKTSLITLTVRAYTPDQAMQWATELTRRANNHLRAAKKLEAEKSIAYLKEALEETSVIEMQTSMYQLIEAQTKTIMFANATDEFALKTIDPAYYPERKSSPRRTLMAIVGTLIGLLMGGAYLLLRYLNQTPSNETEQTSIQNRDSARPARK